VDHSYEEIRNVALDILAGREHSLDSIIQYESLAVAVAEVFEQRGDSVKARTHSDRVDLSRSEREIFREVFWELFRQGIITLGYDDANNKFPFFKVSSFGKRILESEDSYFFHDVSSYEKIIINEVPNINKMTLIYLKEAMQAFRSGCILSASVMLGVATEHTFLLLLETIEQNSRYKQIYASVFKERTILQKLNKFKNILDQQIKTLTPEIKEDLDTNFAGILSIIRNFRNQSGHPTGKIIDREQAYILLQLFIHYCKKMYQLLDFYKKIPAEWIHAGYLPMQKPEIKHVDVQEFEGNLNLEQIEKNAIIRALEATKGNREKAARLLGIGERTLYRKIKDYELV